jgi:L,D-transpeptidase catalytic domain
VGKKAAWPARLVLSGLVLVLVFFLTSIVVGYSNRSTPPPRPVEAGDRIMISNQTIAGAHAGTQPVLSVLNIRMPIAHGRYIWNDKGVPAGPLFIRVDTTAQIISVFRAGHEIGTAVALYGATQKPTPHGVFRIIDKLRDHRSAIYDAPMPYTLRLTDDGIAIHGSDVRRNAATHGCIGVPLEFARLLFEASAVGDRVDLIGNVGVEAQSSS